jgi:hypothetical protein
MISRHPSFAASASIGSASHAPAAAGSLGRNRTILKQNVLALSADLAQASVILANRAGEIVSFASTLPDNCGRDEAAARISAFIESLYPASSSLHSRRSFDSGLGEMIASCIGVHRFPWRLALTTTVLLGLAAILFAK